MTAAFSVLLKGEAPLTADMVVLAIGVTPDTRPGPGRPGLELGIKGSIAVNDRMETSAPDIYAVGDAVQVKHFVTGQDTAPISLAGPANKQGRIAADNICGGDSRYQGSQGIFGHQGIRYDGIATTGINEQTARKAGHRLRQGLPLPHESRRILSRRQGHDHEGAVRKGHLPPAGGADRGLRGCGQAH